MKKHTALMLMIALPALAAGPGCNETELNEDADRATLDKMETEIDEFIGVPICGDSGDCQLIAFGDKPCGGPWKYKVFNAGKIDTTVMKQMVTEYFEYNEVLNERYGWMSDCMLVERPVLDCLDGRCIPISLP